MGYQNCKSVCHNFTINQVIVNIGCTKLNLLIYRIECMNSDKNPDQTV